MALDPWVNEYASSEVTLRVVAPPPPVVVDYDEALEREQDQVLIVPNDSVQERLRTLLPDLCPIAWGNAGKRASLAAMKHRKGRQLFVWLPDADVADWLAESTSAMGYAVTLIEYPTPKSMETLLGSDGDNVKRWVRSHMRPWQSPDHTPDILPAKAPAEPARAPQEPRRLPQGQEYTIDQWMALGLQIANGKPVANISNISLILDHSKEGTVWYDEFLRAIMTTGADGKVRRWTDADDIRTTIEMQRRFGFVNAGKNVVSDAVIEFAMRNLRDCLKEYMLGLYWDGIPRVETAWIDLFGAKDTSYTREVAKNWFKSAVARAIQNVCKVDTMVVFEGAQGIGKSSVLEALGGDWYTIMKEAPTSKDFDIVLSGKHIIEIAEMDAFDRSDVKSTKRTMSTSVDRYRPPYGTHAQDFPRRSVFGGTCNTSDWNTDPTGARRFWPVACKFARADLARANRDQLFAEAFRMLMAEDRAQWWEFTDPEAVKSEQDKRYIEDEWTETIKYVLKGHDHVQPHKVWEALDIDERDRSKAFQMRVGGVMRRLGWKSVPIWRSDLQQTTRCWVKVGGGADPDRDRAEASPDAPEDQPGV